MYGHYALIKEKNTLFYCYLIKKFDFTNKSKEENWNLYKFMINVLKIFILSIMKESVPLLTSYLS